MQRAYDAVADLLSNPANQDKTAEELAKEVVDGMNRFYLARTKDMPPALAVGRAYRLPWVGNPVFLSYCMPDGMLWMTGSTWQYGWQVHRAAPGLQLRAPSTATKGGPGENRDGWTVGKWIHCRGARAFRYRIVATTETSALLEGPDKGLFQAEPNDSLRKYFE